MVGEHESPREFDVQQRVGKNTSLRAIPRILETSTPNSHRPFWTFSKTRLASCSGGRLEESTGEYWRAAPDRYWLDTRQDPPARDTQRDTRQDALASRSGGILGRTHWRAAGRIHWRAALAGYSVGSTGEPLWREGYRRDPLASSSGGIPGGILGGIHWRAALAGFWAGAWCRSIANADSNIKSNNPFLLRGEQIHPKGVSSTNGWDFGYQRVVVADVSTDSNEEQPRNYTASFMFFD